MSHYDLLAQADWKAESVLVVSPYVEKNFFERVLKKLKPKTLIVVIDDGCRSDDVDMINGLTPGGTTIIVVLGSTRGLVHAKIFHIEWRTAGGNRAHTLVYGSGNATRQAFDGTINSELMCRARLQVANHAEVLNWLQNVRTKACNPARDCGLISPLRDAWLAKGVHIRLPSLIIKGALDKASNLDLWLQRGRLLSKYQPDASFLRVHVNLRQELPAGEEVQRIRLIGFETPQARRLSIPYISATDSEEEADAAVNFLSRFFVWTQLGYWCSNLCYSEQRHRFRRAGHERRLANLRMLGQLKDPTLRYNTCTRFLDRIDNLWKAFGDSAETYLESRNGEVDLDFYQNLFEQRVKRDIDLGDDKEFIDRYINGFEVIEVPRFRVDAVAWKSFVESFMRQIHLEWLKAQSQSLLYQYVYAALRDDDLVDEMIFDNPNKLSKALRSNWNKNIFGDEEENTTVGKYIDGYHVLQGLG